MTKKLKKTIAFIGMMGAGKTAVGTRRCRPTTGAGGPSWSSRRALLPCGGTAAWRQVPRVPLRRCAACSRRDRVQRPLLIDSGCPSRMYAAETRLALPVQSKSCLGTARASRAEASRGDVEGSGGRGEVAAGLRPARLARGCCERPSQ